MYNILIQKLFHVNEPLLFGFGRRNSDWRRRSNNRGDVTTQRA
jgi:hypothetical protein